MSKASIWYDNESGTYFTVGDSVIWFEDTEDIGVITNITNSTITVKWESGLVMDYDELDFNAIKKFYRN